MSMPGTFESARNFVFTSEVIDASVMLAPVSLATFLSTRLFHDASSCRFNRVAGLRSVRPTPAFFCLLVSSRRSLLLSAVLDVPCLFINTL
jgi:hypothetical protein